MKPNPNLILLLLFCACTTEKKQPIVTEPADSITVAVIDEPVPTEAVPADDVEEPAKTEDDFSIVNLKENKVLEELSSYPFLIQSVYEMKGRLDSLGVESEFVYQEFGSLTYDSADIDFNMSYGEVICKTEVKSALLPLSEELIIGMSNTDFCTALHIDPYSGNAGNIRYVYTYEAQEHNYTMHFDFVDTILVRFFYERNPCVIYD